MKKQTPYPLFAASLLFLSSFSFAQTPQTPQHAPDGGTRETFSSIFIPSMPDAPFTATVNTEWIRQLPDGSVITLKNHRTVARDTKGRIFQERALFVPDDGKHESTVTQTEISDPAKGERYVCRPAERVCRLEQFFVSNFPSVPSAAASQGKAGAPAVENLGRQTIGGLETIGTRESNLIEARTIGNEAPILEKREFWYSPQLGVNLVTKRQDPRFATQQSFEVSNIVLGEPDTRFFELPDGYQILDQRLRKPLELPSPSASSQN